jgi:hypothetical protein
MVVGSVRQGPPIRVRTGETPTRIMQGRAGVRTREGYFLPAESALEVLFRTGSNARIPQGWDGGWPWGVRRARARPCTVFSASCLGDHDELPYDPQQRRLLALRLETEPVRMSHYPLSPSFKLPEEILGRP